MPKVVYLDAADCQVYASPSTILNNGTDTAQIRVRVLNTDGNPMPGRGVTLSIVSGTGTLTQPVGVTDKYGDIAGSLVSSTQNTVVVKATLLGTDITQQASVVVTSSVPYRANEPAGYVPVTDYPIQSSDYDNWDPGSSANKAVFDGALRTDGTTAPVSPNTIVRASYLAGRVGGTAPWLNTRSTAGKTAIYYSMAFKLSANFQGHLTGTNKLNFVWINGTPTTFLSAEGSGAGTLEMQLRLQNDPDPRARLVPNIASGTVARDTWHIVEVQQICNTTGNADGVARVWMNGTLVTQYTDVQFATTQQNWGEFYLQPIWGGGGDSVTNDMWIDFDHVYISQPA